MKPMLPTLMFETPTKTHWHYEVKYDGFRAILMIHKDQSIQLQSRNEKELLPQFPEIKAAIEGILKNESIPLPLILDGELCLLSSPYRSAFHQLQIRGRMKTQTKINHAAQARPCAFLAFDLLQLGKKKTSSLPYNERKKLLKEFFRSIQLPLFPDPYHPKRIQMIPDYHKSEEVWKGVQAEEGEGIIIKQEASIWEEGKRTITWGKLKNWKIAKCFITSFDPNNGYYTVGVYDKDTVITIGFFYFGISPQEKNALNEIIRQNAKKEGELYVIEPSICIELVYLDWYEKQMREPHFRSFLFDFKPKDCTFEAFLKDEASLPEGADITHPDKPLWEGKEITKLDFVRYIRRVSHRLLSFLENRLLTVIRYPHGTFGEAFYQKNCPEYAPEFVQTIQHENIDYIVCNKLDTLMWLANQLAFEYHIPFQKTFSTYVNEIVFDLDPPSRNEFSLAIKAASLMKELFDRLNLTSFVKTSGNKGLQIYIPLPEGYTWKDTALFTEFIANYLVSNYPDDFTIERLKKNRVGRLYVDYIQHAEGKTIIAPYSVRGNNDALVAAPLWWEEVNEDLSPMQFTMETVLARLEEKGCPFGQYEHAKVHQPFGDILNFLKNNQ